RFFEQEAAKGHHPTAIVEGIMPHISRFFTETKIPAKDLLALNRKHSSLINTNTVGMAPEIADVVQALVANGRVTVQAASVNKISPSRDDQVAIDMKTKDGTERRGVVDAFISSVGPQSRIDRAPIPLYRNMVGRGDLTAEPVTGIGINVDEQGRIIQSDGSVSRRVFSVGPNTGGRALVEEGRIGPTNQIVSGLRDRAERVAETMLEERRACQEVEPGATIDDVAGEMPCKRRPPRANFPPTPPHMMRRMLP
ncbi:MAG: hypothetical protein AAF556_09255, partial [Pseudomonadota bacterium]